MHFATPVLILRLQFKVRLQESDKSDGIPEGSARLKMRCPFEVNGTLSEGYIVLHIIDRERKIQLTNEVVWEHAGVKESAQAVFHNAVDFTFHPSELKSKYKSASKSKDSEELTREIDMEMIVAHCKKVDKHYAVEFHLRSARLGEHHVELYQAMEQEHQVRIVDANHGHSGDKTVSSSIPGQNHPAQKHGVYLTVPHLPHLHATKKLSGEGADSNISSFALPSALSSAVSSYGRIDAPRASSPVPRGGFHTRVVGSGDSSSSSELIFPISR